MVPDSRRRRLFEAEEQRESVRPPGTDSNSPDKGDKRGHALELDQTDTSVGMPSDLIGDLIVEENSFTSFERCSCLCASLPTRKGTFLSDHLSQLITDTRSQSEQSREQKN